MQFTKLRLYGFKSFVDPTEMEIRPGLTGIVGPNGCGKSNLLEAMRWVMGETSAKSMRGGGMDDVIFAGSDQRAARPFAEVGLTVEAPPEELTQVFEADKGALEITRRIVREAGSGYKINAKEARARDVRTLFADASTGARSPGMVRQGRISELVNARPQGRRKVLEEAAGVSGLYARRHEALLRLKAAEENLERVSDSLAQFDSRLASLKRQARSATRYRELSAEIRKLEAMAAFRKWRDAAEATAQANEKLQEVNRKSSETERLAKEAAAARENAADALPAARQEASVAGALLAREAETLRKAKTDHTDAVSALRAADADLERLKWDLEREIALSEDAAAALERLAEEAEDAEAEEEDQLALAETEEELAETTERVAKAEALSDAAQTRAAAALAEHAAVHRAVSDASAALARLARESESAEAELNAADSGAAADALALAEEDLEQAIAAAEEAELTRDSAAEHAERARRAADALRPQRAAADSRVATLAAEIKALAAASQAPKGDARPVAADLRVDPGYESAVAAVLGDDIEAPVAQDGPGWRDWPRLDPPADAPGAPLADHIQAPAALARRLSRAWIVDAAPDPAAIPPGGRCATLNGDLWRWDGLHKPAGGAADAAARGLRLAARLEALQADLQTAEDEAAALADASEAAEEDADAAGAAERAADQTLRESRRAMAAAERRAVEAETAQTRADARRAAAQDALSRVDARRADESGRLAEAEARQRVLGDADSLQREAADARAHAAALRATQSDLRARRDGLKREIAARGERLARVARERAQWEARSAGFSGRLSDVRASIAEIEDALPDLREAPEVAAMALEEAETAHLDAKDRADAAAAALSQIESADREAERAERAALAAAATERESRARLLAESEAARQRLATTAEELKAVADKPAADLPHYFGFDPDEMETAAVLDAGVSEAKSARDRLGPVNLRAEQEANEMEAERGDAARERDDLQEAVSKLKKGVSELNREGRARLLAAFKVVDANFQALFTHLFGGGEARLALTESDDPLEAGLDIMCQPPGKRLQSLSLLSGGEQTLTALALIFAVFLTRPAPVCVLDEVDAPLDEANVERFCDLLAEMTRRTDTRFLIISHHVVTMSRMDRLFGVTMMERGVSRLVSVDLSAAAALAG